MSKKFFFILSETLLLSSFLFAQDPVNILKERRDSLPQENIYVHLDKEVYVAGDTAWFKGYLFSDYNSSNLSSNFFIDLLNENGKVIFSKKFPVFAGTVRGNIDLPDTLTQGVYLLVAYTAWTLNLGNAYTFTKAIPVFNPEKKSSKDYAATMHQNNCSFYPENGTLVSELLNVVAFKATNEYLQPVSAEGILSDSKEEEITQFTSNSNGLGTFSFIPAAGERYSVKIQFADKTTKQYELPVAGSKGILLNVADNYKGKAFSVSASPDTGNEFDDLLLLAVMQNNVVVQKKIILTERSAEGMINTAILPPGLMQVLLFDKNNRLVARRNTLISNKNFQVDVQLQTDTLDFSKKAKNIFSFILPDSIDGNFSLSVTDADREIVSKKKDNIITGLLVRPGCRQFFMAPELNATKNDLDLVALTNDWPVNLQGAQIKYKDQPYISVTGKAFYETEKKPAKDEEINFLLITKDSSQRTFIVPVGTNGSFEISNLVYEDTAQFFFQVHTTKNPDKSLVIEPKALPDYSFFLENSGKSSFLDFARFVFKDTTKTEVVADLHRIFSYTSVKGTTLPEVIMKTRRITPVMEINNRYTKGLFTNSTLARTYDFIHDPPPIDGQNIFEYLRGRVPGLLISNWGGKYIIESPRSISVYDMLDKKKMSASQRTLSLIGFDINGNGLIDGKVFVDEVEVGTTDAESIPISNIAMVKFFSPGSIQLPGVGISCVLVIYTKKVEDLRSLSLNYMKNFAYPGYSIARTFSSPDYSIDEKKIADRRITLYWNPDIVLNGDASKMRIQFYNSDFAKKFHVVLEGITSDGRLLHFDKIVE